MNIIIGENYKLTSDPLNVVLHERYEKKGKEGQPSGEFDFKVIGYFGSVEQACRGLLKREIMVSDAENLSELVGIIYDCTKKIQQAAKIIEETNVFDVIPPDREGDE